MHFVWPCILVHAYFWTSVALASQVPGLCCFQLCCSTTFYGDDFVKVTSQERPVLAKMKICHYSPLVRYSQISLLTSVKVMRTDFISPVSNLTPSTSYMLGFVLWYCGYNHGNGNKSFVLDTTTSPWAPSSTMPVPVGIAACIVQAVQQPVHYCHFTRLS